MPTIPPPPPPLLPLKSENLKSYQNNNDSKNLDIVFKECVWCKDPEVKRACFFARTCCDTSPRECSYMRVKPILQSGPTCGLTTLSMICCGSPTVDSLLDKAIELKYSNNGEMFSTQWLLELLNDNLQKSCARMPHRIRSYIYTGVLDSEFIREKLKQHSILIVPYDADVRNHEPCRMNGHKAHWTLVCGYLIDDFGDFFVFARHGKTKNLGLFSLKDLSDSNSNLNEFSQPSWHPNEVFLLPDGGISGSLGLKSKSIVVEGATHEIVKLV